MSDASDSKGRSAVSLDVAVGGEILGVSSRDAAVQADSGDRCVLPCKEGELRQVEDTAAETCSVARELLDAFEHAALLEFAGCFQCSPVGEASLRWLPKAGLLQQPLQAE